MWQPAPPLILRQSRERLCLGLVEASLIVLRLRKAASRPTQSTRRNAPLNREFVHCDAPPQ